MARPAYLKHVRIRSHEALRSEKTCTVVLLPQGRAFVPPAAHQRLGLADLPPDHDVELGSVAPQHLEAASGRPRRHWLCWVFNRPDHRGEPSTSRYDHRSEAIESCAVEAIDGLAARLRFDGRRWQQRRPSDN